MNVSPTQSPSHSKKGLLERASLTPKQDFLRERILKKVNKPTYSLEKFLAIKHIENELTNFLSDKDMKTINMFLSAKSEKEDGSVEEINNRLKKNFSFGKRANSDDHINIFKNMRNSDSFFDRDDAEKVKKEPFRSRAGYKASKRPQTNSEKKEIAKILNDK